MPTNKDSGHGEKPSGEKNKIRKVPWNPPFSNLHMYYT
jgi:hypothetical protein